MMRSKQLLQARFDAFHVANPRVWELFRQFTFQLIGRGHRHFSADAVCHRIRWEVAIETVGDTFKINNDFTAFYARMFMQRYPEFEGFFRTRVSAAD